MITDQEWLDHGLGRDPDPVVAARVDRTRSRAQQVRKKLGLAAPADTSSSERHAVLAERLRRIAPKAKSAAEAAERLGVSTRTLRQIEAETGIAVARGNLHDPKHYKRRVKHTKTAVKAALVGAETVQDVAYRLGMTHATDVYRLLKRYGLKTPKERR